MVNIYKDKSLLKQRVVLMLIGLSVLLMVSSCEEDIWYQELNPGNPPQSVTNVSVVSGAGKARISYDLPQENVLYVLAEYETREGVRKEAKASRYVQSLTVEGFARAGAYSVSLYAVGLNEERSEPVVVSVEINRPPVITTFESIEVFEDFGGLTVEAVNEFEGELVFEIFTKEGQGDLSLDHSYYTKQRNIRFSARGYAAEPQNFYIVMRDRWGNSTDTLSVELLPFFEQKLDRTIMEELRLPTDNWQGHSWSGIAPRGIHFMFNGNANNANEIFHTVPNSGIPAHFTFDMGKKAKLSRYKLWQRWEGSSHIYAGLSPRKWKVYGSNEPNLDGSWDSWILLGEYEMIKPSGLPVGELTQDDWDTRHAGDEFDVPIDAPAVRFLRVVVEETWGRTQHFAISELEFWGDYQE
ncbi:DUF5000 domain-containing lipoprotein [Belliella marina]|uniref:DUF5000 domain-containing lipoprotein n=1 Tax=Belliella marina TaxID=1644146 RepID=A0ABW4VLP5_9BACT